MLKLSHVFMSILMAELVFSVKTSFDGSGASSPPLCFDNGFKQTWCLLQAPEEVLGYSYGDLGSMSSPSFSDQEMLELVDAQHMMKLLSNGARKGILLWRWEDHCH